MPTRERKEVITIESKKKGMIEIEKTYVELLSTQYGTEGQVIHSTLTNVLVTGNLNDEETDRVARWVFYPHSRIPDFI